jgi:hypothetical protein
LEVESSCEIARGELLRLGRGAKRFAQVWCCGEKFDLVFLLPGKREPLALKHQLNRVDEVVIEVDSDHGSVAFRSVQVGSNCSKQFIEEGRCEGGHVTEVEHNVASCRSNSLGKRLSDLLALAPSCQN